MVGNLGSIATSELHTPPQYCIYITCTMGPLAAQVLECLMTHARLHETLTWPQVQRFLDFTHRILPEIRGSSESLPLILPPHTCGFLAMVVSLDQSLIQLCWTAFSDLIPLLADGNGSMLSIGFVDISF